MVLINSVLIDFKNLTDDMNNHSSILNPLYRGSICFYHYSFIKLFHYISFLFIIYLPILH